MGIANSPVLSIYPHFPFNSTSDSPSMKLVALRYFKGITSLPSLSINPHFLIYSTLASPSLKY